MKTQNDIIVTDSLLNYPTWQQAKNTLIPWIEPVPQEKTFMPAVRPHDILATLVTDRIKMCIAFLWNDVLFPLSDFLMQKWEVSWANIRLAIEENMMMILDDVTLEQHNAGRHTYYSLQHPAPIFNSILPFFKPFQAIVRSRLGETFYMSVPERTTAVFFAKSELPLYVKQLRNDILLTYDCSSRALSPELIEVSDSGIITLMD